MPDMFKHLDHIAIVVQDTESALLFYRDQLKLPVVLSEEIAEAGVRLTHLDLGNAHLQLVQPLTEDHPLRRHLDQHGEGLHHVCMKVDDIEESLAELPARGLKPRGGQTHSGPRGRRAAFIDPAATQGVLWEITADPKAPE